MKKENEREQRKWTRPIGLPLLILCLSKSLLSRERLVAMKIIRLGYSVVVTGTHNQFANLRINKQRELLHVRARR